MCLCKNRRWIQYGKRGLLSGFKSKEAAATSGKRYAAPIRTYQGGTPEAKSQRKDRKAVARVFYIEPGQRAEYPIIFKYEMDQLDATQNFALSIIS